MIVTESEAKTKWCPFVRVWLIGHSSHPAINRTDNLDMMKHLFCVGSYCMMWNKISLDEKDSRGYCGLTNLTSVSGLTALETALVTMLEKKIEKGK